VNPASTYSIPCNAVKKTPKATVNNNPLTEPFLSPATIEWCAHVQVAPDVNKTTVFTKGTSNAFNTSIPAGGHTPPISIEGKMLE